MSSSNRLSDLLSSARGEFESQFGNQPTIAAAAPGRVNLIGEHIDYNDGFVLPFAIDRYTVLAGRIGNIEGRCRLLSLGFDGLVEIDITQKLQPRDGCWTNYVMGVVAEFQQLGHQIPSFDLVVNSNIPLGAGLSSSAALEVATATFLESLIAIELDTKTKALIGQRAEHHFAGMPCGIMDQFASAFGALGHFVKIDCRSTDVELVPTNNDAISFLIADSRASHSLVDGEYKARREQCKSALEKIGESTYRDVSLELLEERKGSLEDVEFRRARHVVTEIYRTQKVVDAISENKWNDVGKLLYESHFSLRDDFEVSCRELDVLVEIAETIGQNGGVIGSRMTGGGFGGATISVVNSEHLESIRMIIQQKYEAEFGKSPNLFVSRPSQGAHLVAAT